MLDWEAEQGVASVSFMLMFLVLCYSRLFRPYSCTLFLGVVVGTHTVEPLSVVFQHCCCVVCVPELAFVLLMLLAVCLLLVVVLLCR